jgi:hypothetical protein
MITDRLHSSILDIKDLKNLEHSSIPENPYLDDKIEMIIGTLILIEKKKII